MSIITIWEQYSISWDWASYSSTHDFQLYRNPLDGTYTLTINLPLDSYVSSLGIDVTGYNNDVLLTMCSIFSSQPQTIYDYIYNGLYIDASTLNTSKYKTVGDCKVKLDENFYFTDTATHVTFYIKQN